MILNSPNDVQLIYHMIHYLYFVRVYILKFHILILFKFILLKFSLYFKMHRRIIIFLGLPAVGKTSLFQITKDAWKFESATFLDKIDIDEEIEKGVLNKLEKYRRISLEDLENDPIENALDYETMRVDILERYYLTSLTLVKKKSNIFLQHIMSALIKIRYYYKIGIFLPNEYRNLKRRIIDFCIRSRIIPTDVVLLKASKKV